jgi:hypothetical protein
MKAPTSSVVTLDLGHGWKIGGIIALSRDQARRAGRRLYRQWKKEGAISARIQSGDGKFTETVAGIREDWEAA